MQIQHQLARLGADEFQFNYHPYDIESWVMSYHLPGTNAKLEVSGKTIQECIDKAIAETRNAS